MIHALPLYNSNTIAFNPKDKKTKKKMLYTEAGCVKVVLVIVQESFLDSKIDVRSSTIRTFNLL